VETSEVETSEVETSETKDVEVETTESKTGETESAEDGHHGIGDCVSEVASEKGETESASHTKGTAGAVHGQQGKGQSDDGGKSGKHGD
jgi:hypothetical protein